MDVPQILRKMEEVINNVQQLSGDGAGAGAGDGAGHLQGKNSNNIVVMEKTASDLAVLEQWCKQKRAELNDLIQQHGGGEPERTSGVNETEIQKEDDGLGE